MGGVGRRMHGRGAAAGVLLALVAGACNDDGRTLRPPPPTTAPPVTEVPDPTGIPPRPADVGSDLDDPAVTAFSASIPDIDEFGFLLPQHTCDGADTLPTVVLDEVPAGAQEVAISLVDLDADGFVHWAAGGVPLGVTVLQPPLPAGVTEATNDFGTVGWAGPCPPPGEVHEYELRVHALPEPLGLEAGVDGRIAVELFEQAAFAEARFTVLAERTDP